MKSCILVVALDARARAMLAQWLLGAGYAVELAESPRRAREVIANADIALAIVAPHGLGSPGLELARELAGQVQELIVIAEQTDAGREAAAAPIQSEARISTPLREPEVLAKVRSALERATEASREAQVLHFDRYTVNVGPRTCVDANGREISLTRAEFSLLVALARQPGRVLSRDELTRAAVDRGAETHDRSVDVLISRLRRKIEPDPKVPRIIVTVPGKGYELVASSQTAVTPAATERASADDTVGAAPAPPRPSIGSFGLAVIGVSGAIAGLVAVMLAFWPAGWATRTGESALPPQKFEAAAVPLVWDYVRTELSKYEREPPSKAIAISRDGWGVSSGAANEEAAKSEALERCRDRDRTGVCRVYAVGDEVVWSKSMLALPLAADVRSEALGPVTSESLNKLWQMIWHVSPTQNVIGYISGKEHKALAVDFTSAEWWGGRPNQSEAVRIAIERCSDRGREPCLLLSVDGLWSVAVPQSHRVIRPFTLAGETEMSEPERQRIAQIYSGKDWRALARGQSGHWYAVDKAQTEDMAADQVMKMCHAAEPDCHLHAIGNWRVGE
jgi:DNA-binding response OmpR family regulator